MIWHNLHDEKPKEFQFCLVRLEIGFGEMLQVRVRYLVTMYGNSRFLGIELWDNYRVTHWTEFEFVEDLDKAIAYFGEPRWN